MNRASNALSMTPMMMGLDPQQQQMNMLQQQSQILGNPTVLGEGSSSGRSMNIGGK